MSLLQTTGDKDKQTRHELSYKQLEIKTNKQDMSLLQTTGGKDEQTRHEPPTNNWR
jgi:hypothetical protein